MFRSVKVLLDLAGTLLMIVAASALLWRMYQTQPEPSAFTLIEDVEGITLAPSAISNSRGKGDVVMVEFGDYECPFCARHKRTVGQSIVKEFVDKGSVQHVFMNFPLDNHANASKAAEAAECAATQGKFCEMHESLFANQEALGLASLKDRAATIGLNQSTFNRCLDNDEMASLVNRDQEQGMKLRVNGTPAFFFGLRRQDGSIELKKKLNGALEFAEFEKIIKELMQTSRTRSDAISSAYPWSIRGVAKVQS